MQFLLLLLLSLVFISCALASPADVLYIQKLDADTAQALDRKDFGALANIFTATASYSPGDPTLAVTGIAKIQALLAEFNPPGLITQRAVSTESITLSPPFDEQGAAGTATGVIYAIVTYIGQGNLTGQAAIFFAKITDKYVKTGDYARHGGWRISQRVFTELGKPVGNKAILPAILQG